MFKNKSYPAMMYLLLSVVSILIVFSFVNIVEDMDKKLEQKISGLAVLDNNLTNQTNTSESNLTKEEMHSMKSYLAFNTILISIIVLIFIVSFVLRSTILSNIKKEDEIRGF